MGWTPQPNSRMGFVCGLQNPVGRKVRFFDDGQRTVRAEVVLTGQALGAGPRIARARAELRRPEGTLCAEAEALRVPSEIQATFEAERPYGRVDPEEPDSTVA
ncbi:MAG: hypothetical protein C4313_08555 [Thermoflexus sp.]|uniref:hypothetical protein n=1 Tax=Thermoflexus sp. TaxID=1969742 RepID=UPI003319C089